MRRPDPRPDLADLEAYLPGSLPSGIHLHANENPYPPPDDVTEEIASQIRKLDLNRYPDHAAHALREALASYVGVDPSWVWVGTGSNEILLDACLAYGGHGRSALLFTPTYSMHERQVRIAGTSVLTQARGSDFAIDLGDALGAMRNGSPDVVFVCSPNNPTGTLTPSAHIFDIARAAPGLVVVDEAYHEFCGQTFVPELPDFPNVIVVRTMSKAFRMAGARLGYAIAQPETLEPMLRVRMPYGQSSLSQTAARVALERRDEMLAKVPVLIAERERLLREMAPIERVEPFPSAANFVLFRHSDPVRLLRDLGERGIVVRDFSGVPGCEGCLRVSVGTKSENDAFLEATAALA